ncbi:MAG TPA: FecR domain-containing protein [Gemmatimonadaceae bacterium]|nr:FecR domain-containing protein [Gemmatimonadaceae bacterium]
MTDEYGPDDPRWAAIHRFLDGVSSLPERREVERWMQDDLSVQRYIKAHKKVWSMIGRRVGPDPVDPADAWESIQDRIAEHDRRERFSLPGRGLEHLRVIDGGLADDARPRPRVSWRIISASAAALVLGSTYLISRVAVGPSVPVSYMAMRGEAPHEQRLPDGVRVVLAPESRLTFSIDRNGDHVATLVGEGSFSVEHRRDRVFLVRAGDITTRDLGTEFDVRAYPGSDARVAVKSGRVSVTTPYGSEILEGGRVGRVDIAAHAVHVTAVSPLYFDWTAGRMAFTDSQLREVADELGRRYDLQFEIDDATLAALPVTITITDGTVEHALALLGQTVAGLQYKVDGHRVQLFRQ